MRRGELLVRPNLVGDGLRPRRSRGPMAELVGFILTDMRLQDAAEALIEPRPRELLVWYRIDGTWREVMSPPRKVHAPLEAHLRARAAAGVIRAGAADVAVSFLDGGFGSQVLLVRFDGVPTSCGPALLPERIGAALAGFASAARLDPAKERGIVHLKRRRDRVWVPAWTYPAHAHPAAAEALARTPSLDVARDEGAYGARLLVRRRT